jgi:hypothetical protein
MFFTLYLVLIAVGLGSVGLHTTLHWFPQSLDEVPMLWFNMVAYYILIHLKTPQSSKVDLTMYVLFAITIAETYIYYAMRSLYAFFLGIYTLTTATVILWTLFIIMKKDHDNSQPQRLFIMGFGSFVVIGFSCWVVDMQGCEILMPVYRLTRGLTLHIIWHLFAGYGGYMHAQTILLARLRELKIDNEINWLGGVIPVIALKGKKEDKKRID